MSNHITPDVEDFIIPDTEPAPATSHPQPAPTSNASNIFSNFGFTPRVDLSSTFAPFTTSSNLPQNTTIKERQYTGGDTLDEPVWATLKRDLTQIGRRLAIVVWPMQLAKLASKQQLKFLNFATSNGIHVPELLMGRRVSVSDDETERAVGISSSDDISQDNLEWDLWGPLIFSLGFAVILGLSASKKQTNLVFSGSFSFIWFFYFVIGLNIQLLGGSISFLSAISAAGYSMFPILVGELICSLVLKWKLLRLILMAVLNAWSIYAGIMSLKCSGVLPGRVFLATYPVGLMYTLLSWLVVIT